MNDVNKQFTNTFFDIENIIQNWKFFVYVIEDPVNRTLETVDDTKKNVNPFGFLIFSFVLSYLCRLHGNNSSFNNALVLLLISLFGYVTFSIESKIRYSFKKYLILNAIMIGIVNIIFTIMILIKSIFIEQLSNIIGYIIIFCILVYYFLINKKIWQLTTFQVISSFFASLIAINVNSKILIGIYHYLIR